MFTRITFSIGVVPDCVACVVGVIGGGGGGGGGVERRLLLLLVEVILHEHGRLELIGLCGEWREIDTLLLLLLLLLLEGGEFAGLERRVGGHVALEGQRERAAARPQRILPTERVHVGLGPLDRVRIGHLLDGHRLDGGHHHLRILEALGDGRLAERAHARKRVHRSVLDAHVLALAFLLLLQAHAEGAADRVTQTLAATRATTRRRAERTA